jgi:Flp pilus assembly protein TadD
MMGNRTITFMLASAAVMGTSLAGCSSTGADHKTARVSDNTQTVSAKVEKALAKKDFSQALILSEELVSAEPHNGDYRVLLGRAYLANGRYLSARTAFTDAMALGNTQSRAIISLALCETGLNNSAAARKLLAAHAMTIPAGDYGLAMAMAGNPQEGVRALLQAVREPNADATTRQNLAYALAMSGHWGQARLIAGQDLSAKDAEARMGQWAWQVLEGRERDRVVAMVGIAPRADDAGLPTRLALDLTAPVTQQVAAADNNIIIAAGHEADRVAPQPQARAVSATSDRLAAAIATVDSTQDVAVAVVTSLPKATPAQPKAVPAAPTIRKTEPAPRRTIDVAAAQPVKAQTVAFEKVSTSVARPAARKASLETIAPGNSDWVIQLGAYNSQAVARERWQDISARYALRGLDPVNTVFGHGGRSFYRLAVRGFEGREAANTACALLKSSGQSCFVRLDDSKASPARSGTTVAKAQPRTPTILTVASR